MNPKKKAVAKNVKLQDLIRALQALKVKYIDVEIQQFLDSQNKLIIKPVYENDIPEDNGKVNKSSIPEEVDDSVKNTDSDINDDREIKDLLDLI